MPRTHTKHLRLRPNGTAPAAVETMPVEFDPVSPDKLYDMAGAREFLGNMSESQMHRLIKLRRIVALHDGPGCRLRFTHEALVAYRRSLKPVGAQDKERA